MQVHMQLNRRQLVALVAASLAPTAWAQTQKRPAYDPKLASPFLYPAEFLRDALTLEFVPAAKAFVASSKALQTQLASGCTPVAAARERWVAALLDWERLSAVAIGPLIERRSGRTVDFWPTRPNLIKAAIEKAPADIKALDRVGAPAKGLPALEWILWQPQQSEAACSYAALIAEECAAEAAAILQGFEAMLARTWSNADAQLVINDWVGQLVGGLEQLRWKKIGKPAHGGRKDDWPRATSGQTRATLQATWEGLENFILGPVTGETQGSLMGQLRGQGFQDVADKLAALMVTTATAVQQADPAKPKTIEAATKALARTKSVVEDEAAASMKIMVGFSDADGD